MEYKDASSHGHISPVLEENIKYLEQRFADCADVVRRRLWVGANHYPVYVLYMDSMINRDLVEGDILKNLMFSLGDVPKTAPAGLLWISV